MKDKVTLGLRFCKVFDRYFVKRCNNCQLYGHFAKGCPPSTKEKKCGKCGDNHHIGICEAETPKDINCIRNGIEDHAHEASSYNCPSYLTQLNEIKKKDSAHSFNWWARKTNLSALQACGRSAKCRRRRSL